MKRNIRESNVLLTVAHLNHKFTFGFMTRLITLTKQFVIALFLES